MEGLLDICLEVEKQRQINELKYLETQDDNNLINAKVCEEFLYPFSSIIKDRPFHSYKLRQN